METDIIKIIQWILNIGSFGGFVKLGEIILNYSKHRGQKKAYLQFIVQQFEYMDFLGQKSSPLIPPLQLEEIYIETRVKRYIQWPPTQKRYIQWPPTHSQENIKSDDDFASIFKVLYDKSHKEKRPLKLAILGPAGCGKTTLMKWLALQCALRKKFFSRFIPVYISLDDPSLTLATIYGKISFVDLVEKRLKEAGLKSSFFDSEFRKGHVLFLLDGLNGRGGRSYSRMIHWIQLQGIGQNVLLISTRKTVSAGAGIPNFAPPAPILIVQDFNKEDIHCFLENWFRSIEIKRLVIADQPGIMDAEKKAQEKCQYLVNIIGDNNNDIFQLLAVKPLCLTTMALVLLDWDRLPVKLHELFKEFFMLIIKLMGNKNFPANYTSLKKIMEFLSKIAIFLLVKKRKRMSLFEIQGYLNEDQLSSLLDDIVLKTGLLYKVNGQYGFTHVTFQEYLVAWHFTRIADYTQMLEYRGDDNWGEAFKFFVNMSEENVIRLFINEIIQGLVEKEYWKQMRIWTNCLLNIADENLQNDIEIQFARKIFQIFSSVKYKQRTNEDDEKFIIYLYIPYPQFKHAMQFKDEAWEFFNHAAHPLVQTFGSSILHDICRKDPDEALKFVAAIKDRIVEHEKHVNLDRDEHFDFLYSNHNSISLIIALRRNLLDFTYTLEKLKSPHSFTQYLFLMNLFNFLDILDTFEIIVLPELKKVLAFLETRSLLKDLDFPGSLDFWAIRDFMPFQDFVDIQSRMDLAEIMDSPYKAVQDAMDKYENEFLKTLSDEHITEKDAQLTEKIWHWLKHTYKKLVKLQITEKPMKFTEKIDSWVNNAYKKLNSLSDKKLLEFFPGTSPEELRDFRKNYEG